MDRWRRLTLLVPSYRDSHFFERPLFRKLIAKTLGSILFQIVIEGVAGFKTCNAYATPPRHSMMLGFGEVEVAVLYWEFTSNVSNVNNKSYKTNAAVSILVQ